MDKFSFIALWDIYNGLLTDVQREITNLYFNLDLTVSEIAEEKGISRQAVSDCLKLCKSALDGYEEKLHFLKQRQEECLRLSFLSTDITDWAEKLVKERPELASEAAELDKILVKDYSDEIEKVFADPALRDVLTKDYTQEVFGRKKTGDE